MTTTRIFVRSRMLLLISPVLLASLGCYQPYMQQPYGPYQSAPYGQPQYGQPNGAPMGAPYGQPAPTGQLMPPSLSANPGQQYYQPAPAGPSDAPAYGQPSQPSAPSGPNSNSGNNSGGDSVPRYNDPSSSESPYFEENEQSSMRRNTFAPDEEEEAVAQADFQRDEPASSQDSAGQIEMTSENQFEPPLIAERRQPSGLPSKEAANAQPMPFAQSEPSSDSGIAPPPLEDKPKAPASQGLEGIVRFDGKADRWFLQLQAVGGQSGSQGRMPLTGTPEVLDNLQSGERYRLKGFIQTSSAPGEPDQFHVQSHEAVQAEVPKSPFD